MKQLIALTLAAAAGGGLVWFYVNRSQPGAAGTHDAKPAISRPYPGTGAPNSTTRATPAVPISQSAADKAVAALKEDILVSLGMVEDVGRQVGTMLLSEKELATLQAIPPAARTPEQHRRLLELERQRATALGMLPEITQFQNNPDEYARFFGSLLTDAGELDGAQSKAVTEYMRARGNEMIAAGLNAAREPTDPAEEEVWEERRDEFNEETATGVANLLPPGEAERIGFTHKFLELMEQDFDKAR